ncbi:MAG: hypothetical protein FJX00_01205 [Alphaproteobacteria bacterium]|nr:hypothetical protein [Alphaproteobacteria bacterium]
MKRNKIFALLAITLFLGSDANAFSLGKASQSIQSNNKSNRPLNNPSARLIKLSKPSTSTKLMNGINTLKQKLAT